MGVPGSYLGILQSLKFARRSLQQVVDEPLGVIASYLRSRLDPIWWIWFTKRVLLTRLSLAQGRKGLPLLSRLI